MTGADKVWPNSVEAQLAAGQAGDFWLIADDKNQLPKLEIDEARKDPKNKEGRHYFRLDKDSRSRSRSASGTSTRSPAWTETSRSW